MYDDVKGIQKNIFFVTHEQEEEAVADGKSKVWCCRKIIL